MMYPVMKGLIKNLSFHLRLPPLVAVMAPSSIIRVYSTATFPSPSELSVKKVGTNSGSFHCDEALGCFMIRLVDKFSGADIVCTCDPKILAKLDRVLDVGGVYDPEHDHYDHHQKGFEKVFGHGFNTKLSSDGLVYRDTGTNITLPFDILVMMLLEKVSSTAYALIKTILPKNPEVFIGLYGPVSSERVEAAFKLNAFEISPLLISSGTCTVEGSLESDIVR